MPGKLQMSKRAYVNNMMWMTPFPTSRMPASVESIFNKAMCLSEKKII
jgi:hypothetical protein